MPSSTPVTPIPLYAPLPLCTPQMPTTHLTHPIQSPSNIQSAPLTMQLTTMHSPALNCFPIPLTHKYLPQHYILRHPQFIVGKETN